MNLNTDRLIEFWATIAPERVPSIEITDNDVEGFGPEVIFEGSISMWPGEFEVEGRPTIANPKPASTTVRGWCVATLVPIYNYPHGPDDVDFIDEVNFETEDAALCEVITRVVNHRIDGLFEREADEAMAASLEPLDEDAPF